MVCSLRYENFLVSLCFLLDSNNSE